MSTPASVAKPPAPTPAIVEPHRSPTGGADAPVVARDDSDIPRLEAVIGSAGRPGVTYAYVLAKNIPKLKAEGFRLSPGGEVVEHAGTVLMVMQRGTPIGVGGGGAELLIDTEAELPPAA